MASNQFLFFAIATAVLLPTIVVATEYVVGGNEGWNINVNYTNWAAGKNFYVGDVLVFKYDPTRHNVYKVDGEGFNNCIATGVPLQTGDDIIKLAAPGKKWYICGFPAHCSVYQQKLVINVLSSVSDPAPAPAPAPTKSWLLKQVQGPVSFLLN